MPVQICDSNETGVIELQTGRMLWVDLDDERTWDEELSENLMGQFVGSRGLGAKLLYDRVPPGTDPLGPDNMLLFVTAALNGTRAMSSPKMTVLALSPQNGFYGESSSSAGRLGEFIRTNGYVGIGFLGRAQTPKYLSLRGGRPRLRSAGHLWGLTTSETERAVKARNTGVHVACIGPAGENLVPMACIKAERRSFGRTGLGAVMGSKNLKALAVGPGPVKVEAADESALGELAREHGRRLNEHEFTAVIRRTYGTTHMLEMINDAGMLPTRNFQSGVFEGADQVSHEPFLKYFKLADGSCHRCPVGCEKTTLVRRGPYAGSSYTGPEWETIWAFGPQCGNADLASIIELNRLCNEYGLDTISAGNTAGFALECYQRGLLTKSQAGSELRWGDHRLLINLVHAMAYRQGLGGLLCQGTRAAAAEIGGESARFAMNVKGLELPAYDPRGTVGYGLALATSSRGACHLRSFTVSKELAGLGGGRFSGEGKAEFVVADQDLRAAYEVAGVCFTATVPIDAQFLAQMLTAALGEQWTEERIRLTGERITTLERMFAVRAGLGRADDILPARLLEEELPTGPAAGHRLAPELLESMLDEYYQRRDWDPVTGHPTEQKLASLGLN